MDFKDFKDFRHDIEQLEQIDINFKTKYGATIPPDLMAQYFDKLTGRVFKILPMSEERVNTLTDHIEYLLIELSGGKSLILNDLKLLELMIHLEALSLICGDEKRFRSQVFRCVRLCKSISDMIKSEINRLESESKGDKDGL